MDHFDLPSKILELMKTLLLFNIYLMDQPLGLQSVPLI